MAIELNSFRFVTRLRLNSLLSVTHAIRLVGPSSRLALALERQRAAVDVARSSPRLQRRPLKKTFGSTAWLVSACSDGKTVVVFAAPESPAAPFYFILFPKNGRYAVGGEGTGPKSLTDPAHAELTRLTPQEIAALFTAAKKMSPKGSKQ